MSRAVLTEISIEKAYNEITNIVLVFLLRDTHTHTVLAHTFYLRSSVLVEVASHELGFIFRFKTRTNTFDALPGLIDECVSLANYYSIQAHTPRAHIISCCVYVCVRVLDDKNPI